MWISKSCHSFWESGWHSSKSHLRPTGCWRSRTTLLKVVMPPRSSSAISTLLRSGAKQVELYRVQTGWLLCSRQRRAEEDANESWTRNLGVMKLGLYAAARRDIRYVSLHNSQWRIGH